MTNQDIERIMQEFTTTPNGEVMRAKICDLVEILLNIYRDVDNKANTLYYDARAEIDEAIGDWLEGNPETFIQWLDDHPEATTTVQDGAITERKINSNFIPDIKNIAVSPEKYGAYGDGEHDDSSAFIRMFSLSEGADVIELSKNKTYYIHELIPIQRRVIVKGDWNTNLILDSGLQIASSDATGSIFENVSFYQCSKVITGDIRYLTFNNCRFQSCNTVFYCEGVDLAHSNTWYGKLDITNCRFWNIREIFYLSGNNFDENYTLSLNAVNFNGGTINSCNVFYQNASEDSHNYGRMRFFRTESMTFNGVDIEKTDFYAAFDSPFDENSYGYVYNGENTPNITKWHGGLYIYNTVFQSCHIEQFTFIWHGYDSEIMSDQGLIRSQVTFDNCYLQLSGKRKLIECDDNDTSMVYGSLSQVSFNVFLKDCPFTINARSQDTHANNSHVIGSWNISSDPEHPVYAGYIAPQNIYPFIKMVHPRYSVIFESHKYNALLNNFRGKLPATMPNSDLTNVSVPYETLVMIVDAYNLPQESLLDSDSAIAMSRVLANTATSAKVDQLSNFATDLGLASDGLNNKSYYQIYLYITAANASRQHAFVNRFVSILNSKDTRPSSATYDTYNVVDNGEYFSDANAYKYIQAADMSLELHNQLLNKPIFLSDSVHYVYPTYRVITPYSNAKNNGKFLSGVPNGSMVTCSANNTNSELYNIINNNGAIQVLDIANLKNNLSYLALSSNYRNTNFANRTDWQNCTALKRVDIMFTPSSASALPSTLFDGCTNLTDIYVPWSQGDINGAPWSDASPEIHYNTNF